jgi:hypothetical protein
VIELMQSCDGRCSRSGVATRPWPWRAKLTGFVSSMYSVIRRRYREGRPSRRTRTSPCDADRHSLGRRTAPGCHRSGKSWCASLSCRESRRSSSQPRYCLVRPTACRSAASGAPHATAPAGARPPLGGCSGLLGGDGYRSSVVKTIDVQRHRSTFGRLRFRGSHVQRSVGTALVSEQGWLTHWLRRYDNIQNKAQCSDEDGHVYRRENHCSRRKRDPTFLSKRADG